MFGSTQSFDFAEPLSDIRGFDKAEIEIDEWLVIYDVRQGVANTRRS